MAASGIDFLAFSAHKVYAPFGCGVLAARKGLLGFGADVRELIQVSGEENVGGIAALGKFLQLLQRIGFDVIRAEEESLTRRALRGLAQVPGLKVHGIADADSPRLDRRGAAFAFQLKGSIRTSWPRRCGTAGSACVTAATARTSWSSVSCAYRGSSSSSSG